MSYSFKELATIDTITSTVQQDQSFPRQAQLFPVNVIAQPPLTKVNSDSIDQETDTSFAENPPANSTNQLSPNHDDGFYDFNLFYY